MRSLNGIREFVTVSLAFQWRILTLFIRSWTCAVHSLRCSSELSLETYGLWRRLPVLEAIHQKRNTVLLFKISDKGVRNMATKKLMCWIYFSSAMELGGLSYKVVGNVFGTAEKIRVILNYRITRQTLSNDLCWWRLGLVHQPQVSAQVERHPEWV